MKRIINIFKCLFGVSKLSSQMTTLDIRISRLQKEKRKSDNELQNYKNKLSGIREEFNKTMVKANQVIDRAAGLQKKLNLNLEAAQVEIKLMKEVTMPGLIAANDTFLSAWDAQSSMNEMRKVASTGPQTEIE